MSLVSGEARQEVINVIIKSPLRTLKELLIALGEVLNSASGEASLCKA